MRSAGSKMLVRMTVNFMLSLMAGFVSGLERVSSTFCKALASSLRMLAHCSALRLLCWKRMIRGVVCRRET